MAEQQTQASVVANLTDRRLWLRLVSMVILAIAWIVAQVVLLAVIVLQFLFKLFTGRALDHLTAFGDALADYLAEIIRFETFVTDDRAFPFAPWPSVKRNQATGAVRAAAAAIDSAQTKADGTPKKATKPKSSKPRSARRVAKPKPEPEAPSSQPTDGT